MTQWPNLDWTGEEWNAYRNNAAGRNQKDDAKARWEMIKSHEYSGDELQGITSLYAITIPSNTKQHSLRSLSQGNMEEPDSFLSRLRYQDPEQRMLVRISVNKECATTNKAIKVEVLKEIIPYKFTSNKRGNVKKIHELHKHLNEITQNQIGDELKDRMVEEYQKSMKLVQGKGD